MSILGNIKEFSLLSMSPWWGLALRVRGVKVERGFRCIGRPGINRSRGSRIELGEGVTLCNTGMANPLAELGHCRLATLCSEAELLVGDRVGMSSAIVVAAQKVEIGEGTLLGAGTMVIDTDFHLREEDGSWGTDPQAVSAPVKIGKNCFIGARVTILKGVTIGDGAVVGAGSVVTHDIPANQIWAGNPARPLRRR